MYVYMYIHVHVHVHGLASIGAYTLYSQVVSSHVHVHVHVDVHVQALTAKVKGPQFDPGWLSVFHVFHKFSEIMAKDFSSCTVEVTIKFPFRLRFRSVQRCLPFPFRFRSVFVLCHVCV